MRREWLNRFATNYTYDDSQHSVDRINKMQDRYVVEAFEEQTACILNDAWFEAASEEGNFALASLGMTLRDIDANAVYSISERDFELLKKKFKIPLDIDGCDARLRRWRWLDELPYKVHTEREYHLLKSGRKKLAVFSVAVDFEDAEDVFAELLFQNLVDNGVLIKSDTIQEYSKVRNRVILYCEPSEAWRIEAFHLLYKTAQTVGWNEGFERFEGSLLGYTDSENDAFIELLRAFPEKRRW